MLPTPGTELPAGTGGTRGGGEAGDDAGRRCLRTGWYALSAPQEARVPGSAPGAGRAAGCLVVVVDTEARLHHHVAVVVLVSAALICGEQSKRNSEPETGPAAERVRVVEYDAPFHSALLFIT